MLFKDQQKMLTQEHYLVLLVKVTDTVWKHSNHGSVCSGSRSGFAYIMGTKYLHMDKKLTATLGTKQTVLLRKSPCLI